MTASPRVKPLLLVALAALAACLALPFLAYADYSNPSVNTVAQMRTDGSLHVVEQRSYAFEEDYAALTWRFTGITDKQEVDVASVRIIQMDAEGNIVRDWDQLPEVAFQSNWRGFVADTGGEADKVESAEKRLAESEDSSDAIELPKDDSYAFDKRRCELYVFLESTEDSTVIECDYAISNAALVYDDTAEMYWDYIPSQPDVEMSNVRTQIQLPVPDGVEVVPGETVRAWGHGPDGTVDVRPDGTVHYFVPEVAQGQYAQAHVLFPRSWLTNITVQSKLAKSGTRFDDAVAEEASWTDTYSWGQVNAHMVSLVLHALCVFALLGAVVAYAVWGRERKPEDDAEDEARTDAEGPAGGLDAAVLGRLLRWNQHSAYDFAATLCQLARCGVIRIAPEDAAAVAGAPAAAAAGMSASAAANTSAGAMVNTGAPAGIPACTDVRFRITPSAKSAKLSAVEQGAMELLFDTIGDGYQSVSLEDVRRFCADNPAKACDAMSEWQDVLSAEVASAGLFDEGSRKASRWLYGVGVVFAVLAVLDYVSTRELMMAGALLATGVVVAAVGYCTPRRTPYGVALAERLEGAGPQPGANASSHPQPGAEASGATQPGTVGSGPHFGAIPACDHAWQAALANAFGDALVA